MALPRRFPVGLQSLSLALPQLQRAAAHPEFVGKLSEVSRNTHPFDGIPLKTNRVPPRSFVLLLLP